MWQGNIVLHNISGVIEGYIGCDCTNSREKLHFLKIEIFRLVLPHLNFWFATGKCYYVTIWRVAKIIHNKSFQESICSIELSCVVVWFYRVHLQNQPLEMFLKMVFLKILQISHKAPVLKYCFFLFLSCLCVMGKYGWEGSIN